MDEQRGPFLEKAPALPVDKSHHLLGGGAGSGSATEQRLSQQHRRCGLSRHSSNVEGDSTNIVYIPQNILRIAHVGRRKARPDVPRLLLVVGINGEQVVHSEGVDGSCAQNQFAGRRTRQQR